MNADDDIRKHFIRADMDEIGLKVRSQEATSNDLVLYIITLTDYHLLLFRSVSHYYNPLTKYKLLLLKPKTIMHFSLKFQASKHCKQ